MLPIKDPPEGKVHMWIKSEGVVKNISCKWKQEISFQNTHIRQN